MTSRVIVGSQYSLMAYYTGGLVTSLTYWIQIVEIETFDPVKQETDVQILAHQFNNHIVKQF